MYVRNFFQLVQKKKMFLLTVFANLIAQLGITYWTMMNYPVGKKNNGLLWFYIIVQFIIIFVLVSVSMPSFIKFILFSLFSFIWGILFSTYRENKFLHFAIMGTAGIFTAMFLIGVLLILFGIQLGMSFGMGLFFGLLFLIVSQLMTIVGGGYSKWLSGFGLILFSLYIVYDTNSILQRDYRGDFIQASLDYYLDIINIFLNLFNQ